MNKMLESLSQIDKDNKLSLTTIEIISDWMDTKFTLPGTKIKFGIDPILSLIPGIGDVASTGISLSVFTLILLKGVPFFTALKMMVNIIIDFIFSAIPILGTIVDIGYKANTRNLHLLKNHLEKNPNGKYHNGIWLVFLLTLIIIAILIWQLLRLFVYVLNSLPIS